MNKFIIAAAALLLCTTAEAKQMLQTTDMNWTVDGWNIWAGDVLTHYAEDGHVSPKGAALATGQTNGITAIAADCIEVTDWVYYARFKAEASVKTPTSAPEDARAEIVIHQYSDGNCEREIEETVVSSPATAGEWSTVQSGFALVIGAESIRMVVRATAMPSGTSALFDDASLTIDRQAIEIFDNPDMSESTEGWLLFWGDRVEYDTEQGHLTPLGSMRTEGTAVRSGVRGAFTGMRSYCLDISDRSPLDQYRVAASAKPDSSAVDPEMGIHVDYHTDTNCTNRFARSLFFGDAYRGIWSRMEATFIPPEGTKGIIVLVRSSGVSEGGGAHFDDISLSKTQAVRQMWLIGVGEISGDGIERFEMQYTRGGAIGGEFDPESIGREALINLEFSFDSCDTGEISFTGEDIQGGYPIYRLATNEAVLACQEAGFENMDGDNNWMSGYWYGGPDTEGEGFAIDVLAGGEQAVVTWYTYLPTWGVDSPR